MKAIIQKRRIIIAAALLALAVAGCGQSQPAANTSPVPTASNLTPEQVQGAKASALRDGQMRAAAAAQQQSQHH